MQLLSCWEECHLGQNRRRPAYWVMCNQQEAGTVIDYLVKEQKQRWLDERYKSDRNGNYYFLVDSARQFVLPVSYPQFLSGQHKAGHVYQSVYREIQKVEDVWELYSGGVID